MNIIISKACEVRLEGSMKTLKAGEKLDLQEIKARRLIDAGYAQPAEDAYRALIAEFGAKDPGGNCWQWIKTHYADLWLRHQTAFRAGNLALAKATFDEMVTLHAGS